MADDKRWFILGKVLAVVNKAMKDVKRSKQGEQDDQGMLGMWSWL